MTLVLGTWDGKLVTAAKTPDAGVKVASSSSTSTEPAGRLVARIAQLSVIDSDGDVTVTGAVGSGQEVVISAYGHGSWKSALPIGKGRVTEEGSWLVLRGQLFLDSWFATETLAVLRGLGPMCEWSYGFNIADSEMGTVAGQRVRILKRLIIHEASPVLRGAGVATGTVEVSSSSAEILGLEVARAALENERKLLEIQGYRRAARRPIGYNPIDGKPVYAGPGAAIK